MSCGCGGGRLPAKLTLRMEAVRLSQAPDSRLDAADVFAFLTEGVDLDALDAPPAPVATGDGPEAVTSRSVLLNTPIQRVAGLDRKAVAALLAEKGGLVVSYDAAAPKYAQGSMALGTLAQYSLDALAHDVGEDLVQTLTQDLRRYGLHFAMDTDALRKWVLEGPG